MCLTLCPENELCQLYESLECSSTLTFELGSTIAGWEPIREVSFRLGSLTKGALLFGYQTPIL